jgi:uncharacterized alpha-E superfamily protein
MSLLSSNAQNIFWLGRYLTRTHYLCGQFPFIDDQVAQEYAQAFCLQAFDAATLNALVMDHAQACSFHQQFECAKGNVHDLRGILTAKAYAELNKLIKNAHDNVGLICDAVDECQDILEAESSEVFLFFSLGQCIEQLDRQIRLGQDETASMNHIEYLVVELVKLGWVSLQKPWLQLKVLPDSINFYQFSDHILQLFEVDA